MIVRPVRLDDKDAVLALAHAAGIGMTSLPPDEEVLIDKITRSVKSFESKPDYEGGEHFLFVLEEGGKILGTTGIKAHVGLTQPFYSYKLTTITQASTALKLYSKHEMLQVTNDLTGASEIGSLYLLPDARGGGRGSLLSRCRYLFMAQFAHLFDGKVIAEMRGVNDRQSDAPFYNSLAKHFFMMDFATADYTNATQGNQFIADLMPKYPIYVSLLPDSAQKVLGKPHPSSEPAKKLLELEGFRFQGYLDVFDAGPTMEVNRDNIRTVRDSQIVEVADIVDKFSEEHAQERAILSTVGFESWKSALGSVAFQGEPSKGNGEPVTCMITQKTAENMQVAIGDHLRICVN